MGRRDGVVRVVGWSAVVALAGLVPRLALAQAELGSGGPSSSAALTLGSIAGSSSSAGSSSGSSGSTGSSGSGGASAADLDVEAMRSLVDYRLEHAAVLAEGARLVAGSFRLDDGPARRVVGVRLAWDAPVARLMMVAPSDGTVLELIVDVDAEVAHLLGVEAAEGTLRTPQTLTECFRRSEPERVMLDCDAHAGSFELDVRVLSATAAAAMSPRDRGWATSATLAVLGDEVWSTRVRPTWVSRDGARARVAMRTEVWSGSSDAALGALGSADEWASHLALGEVALRLGSRLGEGARVDEPTVTATTSLSCGPPYRGCCSPPPRVCTVGPTVLRSTAPR